MTDVSHDLETSQPWLNRKSGDGNFLWFVWVYSGLFIYLANVEHQNLFTMSPPEVNQLILFGAVIFSLRGALFNILPSDTDFSRQVMTKLFELVKSDNSVIKVVDENLSDQNPCGGSSLADSDKFACSWKPSGFWGSIHNAYCAISLLFALALRDVAGQDDDVKRRVKSKACEIYSAFCRLVNDGDYSLAPFLNSGGWVINRKLAAKGKNALTQRRAIMIRK